MQPSEIIFEVVGSPDGGYEAHALGESIFTEAETMEELTKNVSEAVRCHFDTTETRPSVVRLRIP